MFKNNSDQVRFYAFSSGRAIQKIHAKNDPKEDK